MNMMNKSNGDSDATFFLGWQHGMAYIIYANDRFQYPVNLMI